MPMRAVVFDLFDTVVDLHMEDLPEFQLDGRTLRGTHPLLHGVIAEHADLDLAAFTKALAESDQAHRTRWYDEGRELPTLERFGALLRRLRLEVPGLAERLTETHMAEIARRARYLQHHVGVLRTLRGRVKTGICSNFSHTPTAERVIEASGLAPHLDAVAVSEEVGIRKPRPEIFHAVLERLDVAPEDTLHVGDRLDADVRGAAEVGMTPVWITRRVPDVERALARHEGPPPAHTIRDLAELLDLV